MNAEPQSTLLMVSAPPGAAFPTLLEIQFALESVLQERIHVVGVERVADRSGTSVVLVSYWMGAGLTEAW